VRPFPDEIQARLAASAASDFAALWNAVKDEAEARAHGATQKLADRGHSESEAMRQILLAQRAAIQKSLSGQQLELFGAELSPDEKKQWENDKAHMQGRLASIERELETEPADIEALYRVSLQRLEPVGLVYLWPTTRM
jgi:hypothetical protein